MIVRAPRPASCRRRAPRGRNLLHRAADVDGPRTSGRGVAPRDRPVEGPVDLEHPGAVAEPRQAAPVAGRESIAGDLDHLARRDVEKRQSGGRQGIEAPNRLAGADLDAEGLGLGDQGVGDPATAAAHDRPAGAMREHPQDETKGRGHRALQGDHRVGRQAGEQGPGGGRAEGDPGERRCGKERRDPEPCQRDRVTRRSKNGPEQRRQQAIGVVDEWPEQASPGCAIAAKAGGRRLDRSLEHHGMVRGERVGERRRRQRELDAMALHVQGLEEGRYDTERVDR